jgi:hypothetical protein
VALDCAREEAVLRRALQGWLLPASGGVEPGPLDVVGGGTLFLDRLEALPAPVQHQLLVLARRVQSGASEAAGPLPARLAAGSAGQRSEGPVEGIATELLDSLDKIRVEVTPGGAAGEWGERSRRDVPQGWHTHDRHTLT